MKTFEILGKLLEEAQQEVEFFLPDVHFNREGVKRVPFAHIATNLRDLVQPNLTKQSRVFIVGNDGPNITDPDYTYWRDCLIKWLNLGCDITYLLLEPTQESKNTLKAINREVTGNVKLAAFQVKHSGLSEEARRYTTQWRTFHFLITEEPKQLWIECYHEVGKNDAEDCGYFSSAAAEKAAIFDVLKARFNYVYRHHAEPINVAA